jgi:hypothetical protein
MVLAWYQEENIALLSLQVMLRHRQKGTGTSGSQLQQLARCYL